MLLPVSAAAQAFTPPPQVGSMTFGWQWVDNTGHIFDDGTVLRRGQSVTSSALVEVDYGVTERFAATASLPYVFAKYTGLNEPISGLERDACRCWHSSFQDFSFAGRYRFGDEFWAVTPSMRLIFPSHDYPYRGEAVVGPNLAQMQIGVSAAWRLAPLLPKASLQGGYTFGFTEEVSDEVRPNRSNVSFSLGYALTRSLFVHGGALYQTLHDGLTTFEIPLSDPALRAEADRLLKMKYWHFTGGVSYSTGIADLFFSIQPYVWGRNTHDGIAYTVGSTFYFDFSRPNP